MKQLHGDASNDNLFLRAIDSSLSISEQFKDGFRTLFSNNPYLEIGCRWSSLAFAIGNRCCSVLPFCSFKSRRDIFY